jgi:hypothetical protein
MRCSGASERPGRLIEATDGLKCDRGEWCLVAHLRDEDEEEFAAAHGREEN